MFNIKTYSKANIKNDILSGLVVAVALVPEAIAFSFIVGVSPIVGLYTAFILGLITSILGGRPGMISGATGSVAVVLVSLAITAKHLLMMHGVHGNALTMGILQYITLTAILAGTLQILAGVLKLGKFIRLVPLPAIYGFVNGLAIVIAMSQLKFFHHQNLYMYILVACTMLIMFYAPKLTKTIPAGLIAIVSITFIVYIFHIHTTLIGNIANLSAFEGKFPSFSIPSTIFSIQALKLVFPYAVIVALVGLIESLLTLTVLDEMSQTRGSGNKECIALGTGNIACGLFGAMAGCAMIGQSIINFTSGGLGRLSSSVAAIGLILLVTTLTPLLNIIPIAVLVGIMFMVSIGTFEWSSIKHLKHMPKEDAFIVITVTIITIFADLGIAVVSGVIISALVFAWRNAKIYAHSHVNENGSKVYELNGPLFFASSKFFLDIFNAKDDPSNIIIDFKNTRVMDSSGVEAIDTITKQYNALGKDVTLRHLSQDCKAILTNAGPHCRFTQEEDDPQYKVAYNY